MRPSCCEHPMRNKGPARPGSPIRWLCLFCGKYGPALGEPKTRLRLCAHEDGGWLLYEGRRGMPVTVDKRNRRRVFLGTRHPYANSGGWQYLARFLVMDALRRRLGSREQVHHGDGNRLHDQLRNCEALIPELHGRYGAAASSLGGFRNDLGRFVEWDGEADLVKLAPFAIARYGPVVGNAALRLLEGMGDSLWGDRAEALPIFIPSSVGLPESLGIAAQVIP